jgi:hypothetical protein
MLRGLVLALAALILAPVPAMADVPAVADAPSIVVAAATPGVFRIAADGSEQALAPGDRLSAADRIRTETGAIANLIFADRSGLTLGRNAALALERFDYDPATGRGRLVLRLDQGSLRYVGGCLSKSGAVEVRMGTRVATLTGGIGFFALPQTGAATVAMVYGKTLTVTGPNQDSQTIYRQNYGMTLPEGGGPASPPSFLTPGDLAAFNFQSDLMQALLKQMQANPPPLSSAQQQAERARQQAQELLDRAKREAAEAVIRAVTQFVNPVIQLGAAPPGRVAQDSLNRKHLQDTQKNEDPGI